MENALTYIQVLVDFILKLVAFFKKTDNVDDGK